MSQIKQFEWDKVVYGLVDYKVLYNYQFPYFIDQRSLFVTESNDKYCWRYIFFRHDMPEINVENF